MNLSRQPFLLVLLTLVVLVTAAFLRRQGVAYPIEETGIPQTIAARWLDDWQEAWPRTAQYLCGLLAVASALMLGRIGVRYKLYNGGTLLSIPFYGVVACGIYLPAQSLVAFTASFLLASALRRYCASFRNGYTFDAIFRGSICLGAIPLLYAPALPVAILLPVSLLLFKRTVRELIVALCGFLLPFAAFSYLHWFFGGSVDGVAVQLLETCGSDAPAGIFAGGSFVAWVLAAVLMLTVISGFVCYVNDRYASLTKARAILTVNFWLLAATLVIPFLAGPAVLFLPLTAVPAALLLPFLFGRSSVAASNMIYLLVLFLTALHLFF